MVLLVLLVHLAVVPAWLEAYIEVGGLVLGDQSHTIACRGRVEISKQELKAIRVVLGKVSHLRKNGADLVVLDSLEPWHPEQMSIGDYELVDSLVQQLNYLRVTFSKTAPWPVE